MRHSFSAYLSLNFTRLKMPHQNENQFTSTLRELYKKYRFIYKANPEMQVMASSLLRPMITSTLMVLITHHSVLQKSIRQKETCFCLAVVGI